jgi:antitoxin PrlF
MSAAAVGRKGQIIIPAHIRAEIGLRAGDRIEFVRTREGWLIKSATLPVTALKGILGKPRKPVSVEDMSLAVRRRTKE